MASSTPRTISKIYLILALLAAILLSPLPYSVVALALFIPQTYSVFRPFRAGLNLALTFSTLLLLPFILEPSAVGLFSTLLAIPALPLLDHDLRESAQGLPVRGRGARKPTAMLKVLSVALLLVLLGSLLLAAWSLTFASVLLAAYLIGVLVYIVIAVPGDPLRVSMARVRVIAGNTVETLVPIGSRSKTPLHVKVDSPYGWIAASPNRLFLGEDEAVLSIALTPPLSGPSRPELRASVVDPWGLTQISQSLEAINLYVIPKARYAEWLAKKFLAQAALQGVPTVMALSAATARRASGRGVEYMTSRYYQPGDTLRDLDWKRTCKLNEVIVKEYGEPQAIVAILAANLTVRDSQEADELAYTFVTSALTLASVNAAAALAVYNRNEVLLSTKAMDSRAFLKSTLGVAQRMTITEQEQRFLQPPEIRRLKRNIVQLQQAGSEAAHRLAEILSLENQAMQQAVRDHPAARAISEAAEHIRPPALVAVVSAQNHDVEALLVTLDKLERQGYDTVTVQVSPTNRPISLA